MWDLAVVHRELAALSSQVLRSDIHRLVQLLVVHTISDRHCQDILACLLDDRLVESVRAQSLARLASSPPLLLALREHLDRGPRLRRELDRLLMKWVVLVVVLVKDLRFVEVFSFVLWPVIVVLRVHNLEIIDKLIVSDVVEMSLRRVGVDWLPAIPVVPMRC